MTQKQHTIHYTEYASLAAMPDAFQQLYHRAKEATKWAYAPYSLFKVGAAVLLEDGEIVIGSNQENVAYPSGLCAERTALFHVGATTTKKITAVAVAATKDSLGQFIEDISPCGGCRQVMAEFENKQNQSISFIMPGRNGAFIVLDSVKNLLPFEFSKDLLNL